jgi:excisionase family DNA binding protein
VIPALILERETGFEPATLSLGRRSTLLAPGRNEPQPPELAASSHFPLPHLAHQTAATSLPFADTLADTIGQVRGALFGEAELTVRGVAARLRVSTATVYALCRRKELEHHRISHAIRIPESALAKYLAAARSSG